MLLLLFGLNRKEHFTLDLPYAGCHGEWWIANREDCTKET